MIMILIKRIVMIMIKMIGKWCGCILSTGYIHAQTRNLAKWYVLILDIHIFYVPLQWRHNGHDGVSNHQPNHCLLNRLFGRRSKKTSKLHVTGLCVGNSPGTDECPTQRARNAENVSIWWRHHALDRTVPNNHDQRQRQTSTDWKERKKNKSREEIFYQMKVFFLLRSVVGSVFCKSARCP